MANPEPRPIASLTSGLIRRGRKALESVTARQPDAPPAIAPNGAGTPAPAEAAPQIHEPEIHGNTAAVLVAEPAAPDQLRDSPAPPSSGPSAEDMAAPSAIATDPLSDSDFDLDFTMASITPEGITTASAQRAAQKPRRDRRYRFLEEVPPELQAAPARTATTARALPDATPGSGDLPPARPAGATREPSESEIAQQVAAIRREFSGRHGGPTAAPTATPAPAPSRASPVTAGHSLRDAMLFLSIFAAGVAVMLYFFIHPL